MQKTSVWKNNVCPLCFLTLSVPFWVFIRAGFVHNQKPGNRKNTVYCTIVLSLIFSYYNYVGHRLGYYINAVTWICCYIECLFRNLVNRNFYYQSYTFSAFQKSLGVHISYYWVCDHHNFLVNYINFLICEFIQNIGCVTVQ